MESGTENKFKPISTYQSDDKKRAASIWEVEDQRGQKGFRLFMEEIHPDGKDSVKSEDFFENSIYYVEDAAENYVMYIKN